VYGFISEVCPNHYGMQRWIDMVIAKKGDEGLYKIVEEQAAILDCSLANWGF
jgi:hypothetical protein